VTFLKSLFLSLSSLHTTSRSLLLLASIKNLHDDSSNCSTPSLSACCSPFGSNPPPHHAERFLSSVSNPSSFPHELRRAHAKLATAAATPRVLVSNRSRNLRKLLQLLTLPFLIPLQNQLLSSLGRISVSRDKAFEAERRIADKITISSSFFIIQLDTGLEVTPLIAFIATIATVATGFLVKNLIYDPEVSLSQSQTRRFVSYHSLICSLTIDSHPSWSRERRQAGKGSSDAG